MNVVVRKYRDGDLQAVVDLINKADALDRLDEATDAVALREILYRPGFDPYSDTLVVLDEDGSLVGHARLDLKDAPQQGRFYVHTVVDPDWRDEAIEELLLHQLWSRAEEHRPTLGSKPVQFRTYCAAHQDKRISLFERLGLRPVRYDLHMVCHSLENLPGPAYPPGIEVRPFDGREDAESALELINAAFSDVMDFATVTPEDFEHWIGSPSFRAALSFVALDVQSMVGLCLCTVGEERANLIGRKDGIIDSFCVHREYRRRGLGSALLLTSLHAFKRAGLESATLDADTANPTDPVRLYEQVGFHEALCWVTYGKEMGAEATLAPPPL
jgi:mycothiol synthase